MPNGRVMLRSIFKHFQLERGRIGILGERNLLGLKLAGQSVADIGRSTTIFSARYLLMSSPRKALFNHLIDEFEKYPIMEHRVEKAREAHDRHRRSCAWLWAKADLAIELAQQKRNRDEFDQDVKLKPAVCGTGKEAPTSALPAETKKEKKKNKKVEKKGDQGQDKGGTPAAPAPKGKSPFNPPPPPPPPPKSPRETLPLLSHAEVEGCAQDSKDVSR